MSADPDLPAMNPASQQPSVGSGMPGMPGMPAAVMVIGEGDHKFYYSRSWLRLIVYIIIPVPVTYSDRIAKMCNQLNSS